MYIEKIQNTVDTNLEKIQKDLEVQIKKNEQDTYDSFQIKEAFEEELKKYSEPYSPYNLFLSAYKMGASDIRILPLPKDAEKKGNASFKNDRSLVFFKLDGFWEVITTINRNKHHLYINAIKNWAIKGAGNLSPENQRIPQDGKGVLHILNDKKHVEKAIQLRIATIPQHIKDDDGTPLEFGVIRLLDNKGNPSLEQAGFNKYDYDKVMSVKDEKKGLILISGPTGSGKSSTLFGIIEKNNDLSKNIISFENPVEFDIPGISQIEVNPIEDITDSDEITLNFNRAENFAMRGAPDIILVGEIRSFYTAKAAMTFANTGHLTEATIHTNSALETIDRLLGFRKGDSKLDKYLLLSVLKYVSAQMLVPGLCPHCKIQVKKLRDLAKDEDKFSRLDDIGQLYYKNVLKELNIQSHIVKKEMLKPNITTIPDLKGINEEVLDKWIDNSYVENINGCSHCKTRKPGEKIKLSIGRKSRVLINETLLLDEYLTKLLKEEPFSIEGIKHNLLEIRPLLKRGDEGYYGDDEKYSFTTLYQDALFKSIFPSTLFQKFCHNSKKERSISILDALMFGYSK